MIYLDYAANTPVDKRVLEHFCEVSLNYIGNPNSNHFLGREAKKIIDDTTENIKTFFNAHDYDVIFTSGASEANNLSLKGIARSFRQKGKHIITTPFEHSSVNGSLTYLQEQGYSIDILNINKDGTVDLSHLKELLKKDTILLAVSYVDSELGVIQPIKEIKEVLKEYPDCFLHVDATQAVGNFKFDIDDIDCMVYTPHKFFGINGAGVLIKKSSIVIEPLIHGGESTTIYRSGTPVTALVSSIYKSMEIAYENICESQKHVEEMNKKIVCELKKYPQVIINSTEKSVPNILNISILGVKSLLFQNELNENGVCISTKSACSVPNTPSRPVYALTHDKKRALSSWRVSLSRITTEEDISGFLAAFDKCYKKLVLNK